MFCIVSNYFADQGSVTDWAKSRQVTTKNAKLFALTVTNKGADCIIQIFDEADDSAAGIPLEYPLPGGTVFSLTERKFNNGIYVRAVTAFGGSTPISGDDIKVDAQFMTHPCID
jgi:hypothetical protein